MATTACLPPTQRPLHLQMELCGPRSGSSTSGNANKANGWEIVIPYGHKLFHPAAAPEEATFPKITDSR